MTVRLAHSDRAAIIVFMTIVSIKADIVICPSASFYQTKCDGLFVI